MRSLNYNDACNQLKAAIGILEGTIANYERVSSDLKRATGELPPSELTEDDLKKINAFKNAVKKQN